MISCRFGLWVVLPREVSGVQKQNPSQAEYKISCYFGLWLVLPHEVSGVQKNAPFPGGIQDFMLFWLVARATTRSVRSRKKQNLS